MEVKKFFLVSPGDSTQKPRPFYWSLDIGDKWIGVARSVYREKHPEDIVKEVSEAHHLTQLDWRKTPFRNDELATGWLSRDGRFYGCPAVHHDVIAYCVLGMKVADLEEMGWARVYSNRFTCEKRLSAEQRNWLSENGHRVFDSH
ncbi:MAG: hypothetical protein HY889_07290 [Deltaproteobacteria bacterium]|nr:hypothetical protein [Deltaproteobacteria bacterium]